MSARIVPTYTSLASELMGLREGRTVVLTNGCFDVLHVGHVRLLQDARTHGDILVVALNSDESVRASKGKGRPVTPLDERMEMIAALEGVDFVTSFPEGTAHGLLACIQPDVHAKGTDWTAETVPERDEVLRYGGRIVICGDEKRHSSTEIINSRE